MMTVRPKANRGSVALTEKEALLGVPSRCRLGEPDPAARVLFSPSPYPYSPECVEELFSEVELPLDGVLRSSIARTLPLCRE